MVASIRHKTVRGMSLLAGQTAVGKVVSLVGQLVLAALLAPEHFGLIALAFSLMAFVGMVEKLGVREVLIRSQSAIDRWLSSAIWFSGALGLLFGLLLFCAAPLAAAFWQAPGLTPLVMVLAAGVPFKALIPALEARLEVDLRFKEVTLIALVSQISQMALAVVLAFFGFGALAFAIPHTAEAIGRASALWMVVRPRLKHRPQLARWWVFSKLGGWYLVARMSEAGILQIDYIILGMVTTTSAVGFYFFAFNQSTQVVQLFVMNLRRVLMPGLSALAGQPERQVQILLRATRLLGVVVIPFGFLQAAAAGPFLRLLFADRWAESIPLVQILSIGATTGIIGGPAVSLMLAQGRERVYASWRVVGFFWVTVMVAAAALIGGRHGEAPLAVALAVLVFRVTFNPLVCWIACRPGRIGIGPILKPFLIPVAGSAIACGVAVLASSLVPASGAGGVNRPLEALRLAVVVASFGPVYLAWVLLVQRSVIDEFRSMVLPSLPIPFLKRKGGS